MRKLVVVIIICFFQIQGYSQVPYPDQINKCLGQTENCDCFNKLISKNPLDSDLKAHSYYCLANNCSTTNLEVVENFKRAIGEWDLIEYRGHRKHYAFSEIMFYYYEHDFSIDSLRYYFDRAKGSSTFDDAHAASNLAGCYDLMGDAYGEVQDYFSQSQIFNDLINSYVYADLLDSAKVVKLYYAIEGTLDYPGTKHLDKIIAWVNESYSLLENSPFESESSHNLYFSFNKYNEGRVFEKYGEYDKAIKIFEELRDYAKSINYSKYEAIASAAIAENTFRTGDYDLCVREANNSLDIFKNSNEKYNEECEPYYWLVKSNRALNSIQEIEKSVFEGLRLSFKDESIQFDDIKNLDIIKSNNGEYTLKLFLELADFYYSQYQKLSDNEYLLKSRELYNESFRCFHDFVNQQDNLNSRFLNKDIQIELFESLVEIGLSLDNNEQLFETIDRNKMSIMNYSSEYPDINLDSVGKEYTIIQYSFTSDSLIAVLYDSGQYSSYSLAGKSEMTSLISKFSTELVNRSNDLYETSLLLYNQLFKPLKVSKTKLIIIPDNELFYIPFGALRNDPDDNYSFLEKKYVINYQYSMSSLIDQLEKSHTTNSKTSVFIPEFKNDPKLAYADTRNVGLNSELYHLPFAKSEGDFIMEEFNADVPKVTKNVLLHSLQNDAIVHFAGHAFNVPENPDHSMLALSSEINNESESLRLKELLNLGCRNDMLVLSACETGTGKISKGEGSLSLARAFFFAGARSIISTLWSVSDRSSSTIMKNFYSHLSKRERKDVALHQAKLEYLDSVKKEPDYLHPYYWAGFVAVGDMSPIIQKSRKHVNWIAGIILLSILGLGYYSKRRSRNS